MKKKLLFLFVVLSTFSLTAQELISTEFIRSYSKLEVEQDFGVPQFFLNSDVNCYKVTYMTANIAGEPSIASGLVVIPNVPKIYPLLCYQHGTVGSREQVPSNLAGDPLAVVYGAMVGCSF